METERGAISQTITAGTLGAPWLFSLLLMACVFLLGMCLDKLWAVGESQKDLKTEMRIIEVHIQDTNAILIRAGIVKPGDMLNGPTH